MFVIYSPIQYSNQVLYGYYKDCYDFKTKMSINVVNKCSCSRNYIFAELHPFGLLLQYHIPRIIMYASNDAQRRVFVHCAFPVFLIALYLPLTERDSQAQQNKTVHLIHLFIYFIYLFGVLRRFQHYTGHITTGSWKGRGNQYIQFVRVLYCKLPTNGKQLPALPLQAVTGIEPRPQRWEARVLPLCHRGPLNLIQHSGTEKRSSTTENARGRLRWVCRGNNLNFTFTFKFLVNRVSYIKVH